MHKIGDHVVCSGHGVGQVVSLETKEINGESKTYYIIKIISNGMKIMMPAEAKEGIRTLVTSFEIEQVFDLLKNHDVKIDQSTWNRRHRDYTLKVKTGSLKEIADVLRQLLLLKMNKKLSFGEKQMLDQCKDLLVKELALATGSAEGEIAEKIESFYVAQ